jgi:hypothetical protein
MKKIIPIFMAIVLFATSVFAANLATHETNVTILDSNDLTIVSVTPPTNANPLEYTTSIVTTTFVARSSNGASYINSSTAVCSYKKTGETTRTSESCTPTVINATDLNLSCSVIMQYYDAPGTWNINCSIYDNGLNYAENTTEIFSYGSLTSMQLNYTGITFGSLLPGVVADTGPYAVINTGNNEYSDLTIKAFNLTGLTDSEVQIPVTAFKADTTHGGINNAIQLVENTAVSLGVTIPKGAIPTGIRNVWYYISTPFVPPQIYKANGTASWVVAGTS